MHPSAASAARGAIVAIVILTAAVLGLVAGSALNAQSRDLDPGAGRVFANVWGNIPDASAAAAGAPSYADPYRQYIQQAAEHPADPGFVQTWGNLDERRDAGMAPAAAADDAVYENVWGNHADDEPPDASLTRPTLR